MLGNAARRLVDLAVLAFAAYAFVFVPLGKRTAYQHLRAILSSEDSVKAGEELKQAGQKLASELITQAQAKSETPAHARPSHGYSHGDPTLPKLAPANFRMVPNTAMNTAPCVAIDRDAGR